MAKLILSMDGLVLKEIVLNKQRLTIGRKAHNDIQIDNMAISGEHAAILTILSDSFLEDMNSTNGTLVNGQAIKKHFLRNNDIVELGKYRLKYMVDEVSSPAALDAGRESAQEEGARQGDRPGISSPREAIPAAIRLLNGGNAGKELDLLKPSTSLGKPGVQVAVISRHGADHVITHAEGARYPMINGQPIDQAPYVLKDGDLVEIAGIRMEFFLKG